MALGRDSLFPQPWSLLPSASFSSAQAQRLRGSCPRLGPAQCASVPELAMGPGLASPGPLHLQETELQLVQVTGGSSQQRPSCLWPHLDYTTILSAWAQGSCPRGLCFKPGESPASTAPWTASRLLCQPEPPQLTDKHRSSLLPAPAAEAGPCLLLTGSAQPDSLQVFVKRRGVAVQSWRQELNPLLGKCGAALIRKELTETSEAMDLGPPQQQPCMHWQETEVQRRPGTWLRSHGMLDLGRNLPPPWVLFSHLSEPLLPLCRSQCSS